MNLLQKKNISMWIAVFCDPVKSIITTRTTMATKEDLMIENRATFVGTEVKLENQGR